MGGLFGYDRSASGSTASYYGGDLPATGESYSSGTIETFASAILTGGRVDAALVSGKAIYRNPELVTALNLWVDGQEVDYTAWEKGGSSPVFTRKESTSAAYGITLDTKGLEHGSVDLAADGSSVELTKVDGSTCTFTMVRQAVAVAAVFTASKTTSTDGTLKPGTNTVTYRQGMGTGQGVISGPMGGLVVGGDHGSVHHRHQDPAHTAAGEAGRPDQRDRTAEGSRAPSTGRREGRTDRLVNCLPDKRASQNAWGPNPLGGARGERCSQKRRCAGWTWREPRRFSPSVRGSQKTVSAGLQTRRPTYRYKKIVSYS